MKKTKNTSNYQQNYLPVFRLHIGNIAWPMKLGSPNMSSSLTTNRRYAKGGLMTSTSNVTHHMGFKPLSAETINITTWCSQQFMICSLISQLQLMVHMPISGSFSKRFQPNYTKLHLKIETSSFFFTLRLVAWFFIWACTKRKRWSSETSPGMKRGNDVRSGIRTKHNQGWFWPVQKSMS